jgi:hypothetical protein
VIPKLKVLQFADDLGFIEVNRVLVLMIRKMIDFFDSRRGHRSEAGHSQHAGFGIILSVLLFCHDQSEAISGINERSNILGQIHSTIEGSALMSCLLTINVCC